MKFIKNVYNSSFTSVYNPSVFESWSLTIQKLIPHQTVLVELLDALVEACKMEKAFLFDAKTRVYLATDHNPIDHQTLTLCADSIDIAVGFEEMYGSSQFFEQSTGSSTSVKVKISNEMILFCEQVGKWLALVCVSRKESWADPFLIERNVQLFKTAITEVKDEL